VYLSRFLACRQFFALTYLILRKRNVLNLIALSDNRRLSAGQSHTVLLCCILLCVSLIRSVSAQGTVSAPGGGSTGSAAVGSGAPAGNGPAPGISSGVPTPAPNHPLTLEDVVRIAVGGNSGLVAARQRLQKAQELINQVNAQGKPQLSAQGVDTYSSYNAFAPSLSNPVISNPTLPGGGQIPVVVDQGNGFSTAFIGGGGGGNAPSSGEIAPSANIASPSGSSTPGMSTSPVTGTPSGTTGSPAVPSGASTPTPAPASPATSSPAPSPASPAPASSAPSSPTPASPSPASPAPAGQGAASPGVGAVPSLIPLSLLAETTEDTSDAPITEATSATSETASRLAEQPRDTTTTTGSEGTTGTVTSPSVGAFAGQRNDAAARLSVSQYLDLFGLLSAARGAQQDVRDFYALDIERLQNETALAAKNLFFNSLLAQSQVDTENEQVLYAQEDVRITQSRLKQGIVSRFDVLTAQTALSSAQQALIAAQDQHDLAQADLAYLLGTDPDQPLTLQAPVLPSLDQPVDIHRNISLAQTNRPEVKQASANIREARRLVKLAGSSLLPTLGLVANAERASIAAQTSPESYANISAELAFPFDDGGATRSRVRSAQVDVQTQTLTLSQIQQTVALEVRQASLNVHNAQAQISAAQTGAAQAQEAVRLAYLRYQGGLGTFLDVLNALAQLAQARTNLANANFFYQTSLAQLVRATGGR